MDPAPLRCRTCGGNLFPVWKAATAYAPRKWQGYRHAKGGKVCRFPIPENPPTPGDTGANTLGQS